MVLGPEEKLRREMLPEMDLFGFPAGAPGGGLVAVCAYPQRRIY